jgi:hypothetical protein
MSKVICLPIYADNDGILPKKHKGSIPLPSLDLLLLIIHLSVATSRIATPRNEAESVSPLTVAVRPSTAESPPVPPCVYTQSCVLLDK